MHGYEMDPIQGILGSPQFTWKILGLREIPSLQHPLPSPNPGGLCLQLWSLQDILLPLWTPCEPTLAWWCAGIARTVRSKHVLTMSIFTQPS